MAVQLELIVCDACGLGTTDPQEWRGFMLCPSCFEKAEKDPEGYKRKLGLMRTVREQEKKQPKSFVDQWANRLARMHPQHSQMELVILEKLHENSIPVLSDQEFTIQSTTPDFYFPRKQVALYLDGPAHKGKEDRDEQLRELLAKRHGIKVVSISYERVSKQEAERIFKEIMEALQ